MILVDYQTAGTGVFYRSLYTGVSDQRLGNWNGKDKEKDIKRKERCRRVGGQGEWRTERKSWKAEVGALTVSNHESQSSWWLQVPIRELSFWNHFRNFPTLFRTRKYWSSQKYWKCYDCIHLTLLSSSSYSIYYYTLKLSSRIITTILYKYTSAHSIYTFTLVTNTSVIFAHLRQWLRWVSIIYLFFFLANIL